MKIPIAILATLGGSLTAFGHPEPRLRFLNQSLADFTGVSVDGTIAVGSGYQGGFRWRDDGVGGAGTIQWVGRSGGIPAVTAVSRDGEVATVVERPDSTVTWSFVWTLAGTKIPIPDSPGGTDQALVFACSADGRILAGSAGVDAGSEAALWNRETGEVTTLGEFAGGSYSGAARAISADGSVIFGASQAAAGDELFRWTHAGGMERLGVPLPRHQIEDARAMWCSADGSVVAGSTYTAPEGWRPFVWSRAAGVRRLGTLSPPGPGGLSRTCGISADGRTVIGRSTGESFGSAFYWTEATGMRELKEHLIARGVPRIHHEPGDPRPYADWYLMSAQAISADGNTIVGIGGVDRSVLQLFVANLGFCRADLNRDDFLDLFDYVEFVDAIESGAWTGDFNRDGFIDFFDYADFVDTFETGC